MQIVEVLCSRAVSHKLWDKHQVDLFEVDEVLGGDPYVRRGREGLHYVLGQTSSGRYLFVVIRYLGRGSARLVTARDMDPSERRAFRNR